MLPRRVRVIRSVGRRGGDLLRPNCIAHQSFMVHIICGREAVKHTTPMFLSTVAIRLFALGFNSLLVTSFSRARTTPSLHLMPIAVPPFSTALTAYSTCGDVSCDEG